MENSPDKYIRIYVVKYLKTLERFLALPRYRECQCQDRHTQLET